MEEKVFESLISVRGGFKLLLINIQHNLVDTILVEQKRAIVTPVIEQIHNSTLDTVEENILHRAQISHRRDTRGSEREDPTLSFIQPQATKALRLMVVFVSDHHDNLNTVKGGLGDAREEREEQITHNSFKDRTLAKRTLVNDALISIAVKQLRGGIALVECEPKHGWGDRAWQTGLDGTQRQDTLVFIASEGS